MDIDYVWDFGDGNTSTEPNPTHTYTNPGVYVPQLTYTIQGREPVTVEKELIYERPIPVLPVVEGPLDISPQVEGEARGDEPGAPGVLLTRDTPNPGDVTFQDIGPDPGDMADLPDGRWIVINGQEGDGQPLPDLSLEDPLNGTLTLREEDLTGDYVTVVRERFNRSDPSAPVASTTVHIPLGGSKNGLQEQPTGDLNGDFIEDDYMLRPKAGYTVEELESGDFSVFVYDQSNRSQNPAFPKDYTVEFLGPDNQKRGPFAAGSGTTYSVPSRGTYQLEMTITDSDDNKQTINITIEVGDGESDIVNTFDAEQAIEAVSGSVINLKFTGSSINPITNYQWGFQRPQDDFPTEPDPDDPATTVPWNANVQPISGNTPENSFEINVTTGIEKVAIHLTVTDNLGASETTVQIINVFGIGELSSPTADFDWKKIDPEDNTKIQFTSKSRRARSLTTISTLVHMYSFGDGTFGQKRDPLHTYPQANQKYRVTLFITEIQISESDFDADSPTALAQKGLGIFDSITKVIDTGEEATRGPIPSFNALGFFGGDYETIEFEDVSRGDPTRINTANLINSTATTGGVVQVDGTLLPAKPAKPWTTLVKWTYEFGDGSKRVFPEPLRPGARLNNPFLFGGDNDDPPNHYRGGNPGNFLHEFPKIPETDPPNSNKTYNVKLTLEDAAGQKNAVIRPVTLVDARPRIDIEVDPISPNNWRVTDRSRISVNAELSTEISRVDYTFPTAPSLNEQLFSLPATTNLTFPGPGTYPMELRYEDDAGAAIRATIDIPNNF